MTSPDLCPSRAYRLQRRFRALREDAPGAAFGGIVRRGWHGWRSWFEARGGSQDRSPGAGLRALRRHLPEMERLLGRLAAFREDDPVFAEFLGFWCPPRYLVSCSQAVAVDAEGPFLIRNYDLDPALNEAVLLATRWRGRPVMGMAEGLAGLSDGMNADGLAISLTFGGRVVAGRGFGIPLIMRYVLETCRDTQDALEALRLVPCHMSYNVTAIDASGRWATAFLAPDRPAIIARQPWAANHQLAVEWPRHGRISATLDRARLLAQLDGTGRAGAADLAAAFARPPLRSSNYRGGFGTVFTALYRPLRKSVELRFGSGRAGTWSIGRFAPSAFDVEYTDAGARFLGPVADAAP
ncbi:C45 family autoproteolytic acyltransferase/hydolase [Mangrovicoccus sp. HB161399]|uniref:C45 family autoproteolytic acyltransferase/hydolase n=1 Tax=Mangrovicoccus sp. HB161399 TaxID=2720392 RepID=UPI001557B661|nr:C45 family peptidase [Mangrovicoccus sp. HB161399]